jgi:hypothetical protein
MNQPQDSERRAVPRYIRDAEHDMSRDLPAGPESAGRRLYYWLLLFAAIALMAWLWYRRS